MSDFIESNDLMLNQNNNEHINDISKKNSYYCKNEFNLNEDENKAVDEFLKRQNWPSNDAKNWNIAVKFLMARKFDVERAIQLYTAHNNLRVKENLHLININDAEFLHDLETGKFTILPFLKNYPVCALFTVRLHTPTSPTSELTTLRTLIYQLDAALENPDAQRNGIIFIYDMNNCKSSNYDLTLSKKILTLIKGSYPARLNRLYVVSAPFWFKCLVKMLSVLMREKLRDRVAFVTNDELQTMVPKESLPNYLGGNVSLDHKLWLKECQRLITNKTSTCYYYYCTTKQPTQIENGHLPAAITNGAHDTSSQENSTISTTLSSTTSTVVVNNNNRKRASSDFIGIQENQSKLFLPNNENHVENGHLNGNHKLSSTTNGNGIAHTNGNGVVHTNGNGHVDHNEVDFHFDEESIQQPLENGLTIEEIYDHVYRIGVPGLLEEYKHIRLEPISSTTESFEYALSFGKNRYRDVPCLDDTRVKLVDTKSSIENGDDDESVADYIHANYVDGYKQKNAYISTQGPLDETCEDFWRMIWQEKVAVIVMTTKCVEQRKKKCAQYWPNVENESFKFGSFDIQNKSIDEKSDYTVSKLVITNETTNEQRELAHCQFTAWPDHGIPTSACEMLDFVHVVREYQANLTETMKWKGHPLGAPILVHCSAGIGRTGTFCTIDININRLLDTKKIDIKDTVLKIRSQRALSVQMPDQYVFCYRALIEYAIQEGLLSSDLNLGELFD